MIGLETFNFLAMSCQKDQRSAIKFCALLGNKSRETENLLKYAYKDESIRDKSIRRWHKHFCESLEATTANNRTGRLQEAKSDNYEVCFSWCIEGMTKCINCQGDYFEKC